jgi:hypothetical protein
VDDGATRKPYTAYRAPEHVSDPRPRVIFWYRAYAAVMMLASLALLGFAVLTWSAHETQAILLLLVAMASVALYGTAALMPFKPWAWTLGLIVIALGVPGVTVVVCVPLLLAWMKPNVKAAFCRL